MWPPEPVIIYRPERRRADSPHTLKQSEEKLERATGTTIRAEKRKECNQKSRFTDRLKEIIQASGFGIFL